MIRKLKCNIIYNKNKQLDKALNNNSNKEKKLKIFVSLILLFFHQIIPTGITKNNLHNTSKNKIRVGVTCLNNCLNVGNILVKYAMLKKLEEFGLNVTLLIPERLLLNSSNFITKTISSNLYLIKDRKFDKINESFDYLLVNSDQTWAYKKWPFFYDIGFLKFAKDWKAKKFIYGASIGTDKWNFNNKDEEKMKNLLTNFKGISFREIGTVKLVEEHLGIKSKFVLDPTLIIDKQYYLNEIKEYKPDFNYTDKYIFIYQLDQNDIINNVIEESKKRLKFKIHKVDLHKKDFIENFIFCINNCQAVITDSFHGTIFSIIFNKPFISFINKARGKGRFDSLKKVFKLDERIIIPSENTSINFNLLINKPKVNQTLFNQLRDFSIDYLKKNLDIL